MKNKIILMIITITVIGLVTGCGCQKKKEKVTPKDDVKINTNEGVIRDQEVDGIRMTNTSLITQNGLSYLNTKVTNNTKKDYKLEKYWIIVKDKDGKVILKMLGYVGEVIKAGETRELRSTTTEDLSSASSIEYEVVKSGDK